MNFSLGWAPAACKFVYVTITALLICTFFLGITPQKASAQSATGQWIDAAHIRVGSQEYIDLEVMDGDSMDYFLGGVDDCTNVIKGFNKNFGESGTNYANAELITKTLNPRNGECDDDDERPITLSNTENARIFFHWVDSETLETAFIDGPSGIYKKLGSTNEFIHDTDEDCRSTIVMNSPSSGDFIMRMKPFRSCVEFNTRAILVGSPGNSSIPAGEGEPSVNRGSDTGADSAEQDNSCETNSGVLGWIMCPVAGVLDSIVGFLDEQIRGQLHLREDYFRDNGNGNPVKDSWTQLRNIAYVILVPIMLVMVIGTALGFEVFSAYTIQKALPRMAIAVIFIALSWYICLFMVDLFNVMGAGIKGLITGPFSISNDQSPLKAALTSAEVTSQGSNTLESISSGVTTGGLAIAGTAAAFATGALSLGIIGSTLATAALVLGGVFLLLVARQIILIALFLLAPLAILSWIFPGNDKMWKLWWGSFSKLLMLFPLIMLLLGVGEVFAHITGAARSAAGQDKLVTTVIVIGSFIMPFFFIPFAFKWAGGVFGNLAGMVNDRERGMLDRLKKGRSESRSQGWQRFKTGTGTGFAQRNRIARGVGTRLGAGVGGGKGVFGFGEKGRARMDQMNRQNAIDQIMKNPAWNGVNQDDNALHAGILMEDMSKQEAIAALVQQRGLSQAEAERAAAAWGASGLGGRAAAIAAAQQLVSTGTGYNNLSDMTKTLARASGGNASTATALAGFANAETKKVGRNDLAPGFSTANSLTQGWLDEGGRLRETNTASKASWTEAHDQTWRSGSLYQLANGKPKQMEAFADHWTKEYEDSVRLGDSERAVVASRALEEMREMQSNATGENSEIIRRALERREAFDGSYAQNQGNAAQQTTGSPNTPGGTAAGYQSEEAASQYIADIKTRSRQGARVYQRPDPNNMT